MRRSTSFVCDECDGECFPEDTDHEVWLYQTPHGQLCWECMKDLMGIEVITE